jgi:hypothetical protein
MRSLVPTGRKLIQHLVTEHVAAGREPGDEPGVQALLDPLDGGERRGSVRQLGRERF